MQNKSFSFIKYNHKKTHGIVCDDETFSEFIITSKYQRGISYLLYSNLKYFF